LDVAPLAGDLLQACPQLKVLATSREELRIYGEQRFAVQPFALPYAQPLPPIDDLLHFDAIRLFVARARAVKPDFSLTVENAASVVAICRLLAAPPPAIERAAARVRVLPPPALLPRLAESLKVLIGGARDLPERQQTLQGTIAWSYDLLTGAEKA